ncbi:TPA: potassium uptake system protein [Candidatus Dependentiae bacterium]|nr:MAG: TrkA-N domain protein [candidate division TM6 bacterium GW2011_GWF2_43_87]HBL98782.1 potassium uptake system protein [Candidatus Dependentiae bacterium]
MKCCVIGLGRFGYSVATKLAEQGADVLAVDSNESIINSIKDLVTQAVCLRVADEEALKHIGVEEVETVVVGIGENFAQSILITALLKQRLNVPNVIVRSISAIHRDILVLVGADHVILPEQEMGIRLADQISLTHSNFVRITDHFSVSYYQVPERFVNRTVRDLDFERYSISLIGKKVGEDVVAIAPDARIEADDVLIFAGPNKQLEKLEQL